MTPCITRTSTARDGDDPYARRQELSGRRGGQPFNSLGHGPRRRQLGRLPPGLAARHGGNDGGTDGGGRFRSGPAPRCASCRPRKKPTAIGPRTCGSTATPYWDGIQMDETALPILLVDLAYREQMITDAELSGFWPMVRRSACYLVHNGPVTQQDRWEEDSGYSPFTLAAEIAALLVAADMAEGHGEARRSQPTCARRPICGTRISIAGFTPRDTELARRHSASTATTCALRPSNADGDSPLKGIVPVKNRRRRAERGGRPPTWSAPTPWRWCASACAPPTIRGSSIRSKSSTRCSKSICRPGPAGIATTKTATANTPTARLSTASASAGPGRY